MKSGREQLADWIRRRAVSQVEAAELLGMSKSVLHHFLSGRRSPGVPNAVQIERVTGIPVEAWLPTEEGNSDRDLQAQRASVS